MLEYQATNIGDGFSFRSRSAKNYSWPPHLHEYTELMYVKSGKCVTYVDGTRLEIPEGHAVFIFPNCVHEYTDEAECDMWWAVFSNDFLNCFYSLHRGTVPTLPVVDLCGQEALINELMSDKKHSPTKLAGMLNLLFALLESKTDFERKERSNNSLYLLSINYISEHFKEELTLAEMARALGYHEKYLSSALHDLTKMNFCAFLSTYRVDHAKKLLRTTDMGVAEIALNSGFSYASTFTKTFKKLTGITPLEYRRGKKAAKDK